MKTFDIEPREKVIVRSNGVVTYVGKDIANQFWKFGLLGRDFHYRVFDRAGGRVLWNGTDVTDAFRRYLAPLLGSDMPQASSGGSSSQPSSAPKSETKSKTPALDPIPPMASCGRASLA